MNPAKAAKAKRMIDLATEAVAEITRLREKVEAAKTALREGAHRPEGMRMEDAIGEAMRHERRRGRLEVKARLEATLGMSWEDLMGEAFDAE